MVSLDPHVGPVEIRGCQTVKINKYIDLFFN